MVLLYSNGMLRHFSWRKGPNVDDSIRITRSMQGIFHVSYNTENTEHQVNLSGLNTVYVFIGQLLWYSVPWNTYSVNSKSSESYTKRKHTALRGIKPQTARQHREITSMHIYSVTLSSRRLH